MWKRPLLYHRASHAYAASRDPSARHILDDTLNTRPAYQPRLFTVAEPLSPITCGCACSAGRSNRGFTLIDVLIAVAIVGILAAIAYPSYQSAVRKSNRAAAESHLADIAQRQQQFLLDQRSYAADLPTLGVATPGDVASHYTITCCPALSPDPPPSFQASATPTGSQAGDLSGLPLTITNTGAKGPSGAW